METSFTIKLFKHGADEGTLIVLLNTSKKVREYFVEVFSFNRMQIVATEIKVKNRKYFHKKNLLVVYDLTHSGLYEVVTELEETGDFFEIMRPLSWYCKMGIYRKNLLKNLFNKK